MEEKNKGLRGFKLLCVKLVLGAIAALVGIAVMRIIGGGEILVAILIGLVPGIAEKSTKKTVAGAILGLVGYIVGGQVGHAVARVVEGVPFGHWMVTGAFIGLTSGISRTGDRWLSPRPLATFLGAFCGLILGAVFGFLGDGAGLLAAFTSSELAFYHLYMRESSLLLAGIFINFGSALASGLTASLEKKVGDADEPADTAAEAAGS
jgi:hypothetical protein